MGSSLSQRDICIYCQKSVTSGGWFTRVEHVDEETTFVTYASPEGWVDRPIFREFVAHLRCIATAEKDPPTPQPKESL